MPGFISIEPATAQRRKTHRRAVITVLAAVFGVVTMGGCDAFFGIEPAGSDVPGDVSDVNSDGFQIAAASYSIDAKSVTASTWDFAVLRDDGQPLGLLRFVWDSGIKGNALREGATQRFAYPEAGDYVVTVTALGPDDAPVFTLTYELEILPLPDLPPIARAGNDLIVFSGDAVCLDGSASFDVNGAGIRYDWWQLSGTPVVLRADASPARICFTAPAVAGTAKLQFGLRVSNAKGATEDTVIVEVISNDTFELIANAGSDVIIGVGGAVTLDGSASRAPDGSPLEYSWTQLAGPTVSLAGSDGPIASFTAPEILEIQQQFRFLLTVTAGEAFATDEVQVTVWQLANGETEYFEDFNAMATGADPPDWLDTGASNSLSGNDALFGVLPVNGNQAFGTESAQTNVHSHYVGNGTDAWGGYTYTGRMMVEQTGGGVGVTFLSDYPNSDRYYRLRCFTDPNVPDGRFFHIAPHGSSITSGDTGTGIQPFGGEWYHFEVQLDDTDSQTQIRARVWPESSAKPVNWQIDCVDASPTRFRKGTVGLWSMGLGAKHWDDLRVTNVQGVFAPPVCLLDSDLDGVDDCLDLCPDDPEKIEPGECGCGQLDEDLDGNGTFDCFELPPALLVSRTLLNFSVSQNSLSFDVWNAGGETLEYSITENASWLSVSPTSGSSTGEHDVITATVSRDGLADGTHQTEIIVTPNVGAPFTILVTLLVQPPSSGLTPIARWDVVPRQRIESGEVLQAGVVAFSKFGIREVQFHISGQGYSGVSPKVVTQMTHNDRVDVWEYWTPIAAGEFASDGPITVEAVVIGNDGGVRDKNTTPGSGLEALTLFVNPNGTLPSNTAYVDLGGNDSTGQVNNPARPYRHMGKAMQAIEAFQGGNADGGIVRLRPGNHIADGGGVFNGATARVVNEWITITHDPSAGGNQSNTRIVGQQEGDLTAFYLKVQDLTLSAPNIINGGNTSDSGRNSRSVWLKDCNITGGSGNFRFPVGSGWRGPHYYTECVIADQRRASGNGQNHRLMRNLTMLRTREDNFQSVPCGINIWVDGSDPGPGENPEHSDVIQGPPAIAPEAAFIHNWIWYNVVAKDLHYQGIFVRSGAISRNNAFVNCFMEMRSPVRNELSGRGTTFGGKYDHLLFWHCTFIGTGTKNKFNMGQYEPTTVPSHGWLFKNASVRGCVFERFRSTLSAAENQWIHNADNDLRDNHYITQSDSGDFSMLFPNSPGGTITTGNANMVLDVNSDDFGKPLNNSPLIGRIDPPLIPADAYGQPHGTQADAGALAN